MLQVRRISKKVAGSQGDKKNKKTIRRWQGTAMPWCKQITG
jgi:hypothetical protein